MFARLLILFYAIASYAVFLVSSLYAIGFVGNYLVPKSIDSGGATNLSEAIVVDLLLLGLFAIQHSIMARPAFKQWWARIFPVACQRSTYVLLSSLILLLLFWQWRPIPIPVWQIDGIAAWVLIGVYWLGWMIVFASTFMIDHFDLSGLRQAFFALRGAEVPGQSFKTPLLYKIVRHPLMLGFLLAFWATPEMTAGHLLFAIMTTAYILVGLQFEERDLIAEFGTTYQQYRRRVPMLLPRIFGSPPGGSATMRAVLCSAFTGPEDLRIGEIEEPKPASDEILIDVHAASVSFMDHLLVSGRYQMRPPTPFVPGTEAAGIVIAVGEKVTRFRPGDRVACGSWTGGYAERMIAKEWKSVRLPAGVAFETAATVWHNYGTAYYALVEGARAQHGETVFVTGAAGGVGLAAVDLAGHLGLRVIAGVGSDDKAGLVRGYGASDVINYRSEDLRERIKSITGGEGVDICFDNVGGTIFEQMARLMKWGGRLMPIGFTSGQIPSLPMNLPLLKNYSIVGVFAGAWAEKFPEQAARMNDTLAQLLAEGKIRPHIDRVLPLEQVKEAMRAVANRTVQGRIVLKIR